MGEDYDYEKLVRPRLEGAGSVLSMGGLRIRSGLSKMQGVEVRVERFV